jgi:hypothetical protein
MPRMRPTAPGMSKDRDETDAFDCNICLCSVNDPVVTMCAPNDWCGATKGSGVFAHARGNAFQAVLKHRTADCDKSVLPRGLFGQMHCAPDGTSTCTLFPRDAKCWMCCSSKWAMLRHPTHSINYDAPSTCFSHDGQNQTPDNSMPRVTLRRTTCCQFECCPQPGVFVVAILVEA